MRVYCGLVCSETACAMSLNPFAGHPPGLVALPVAALQLLSPFLKKMMHLDKPMKEAGHGS